MRKIFVTLCFAVLTSSLVSDRAEAWFVPSPEINTTTVLTYAMNICHNSSGSVGPNDYAVWYCLANVFAGMADAFSEASNQALESFNACLAAGGVLACQDILQASSDLLDISLWLTDYAVWAYGCAQWVGNACVIEVGSSGPLTA